MIAFDAIFRTRSVVKAAGILDAPQSTVSRWLAKLRDHFDDPLFVKTQQGMYPTPVASKHAPPIAEIVRIYQNELCDAGSFDPATTAREFNIATSDVGSLLLLPALHRYSKTAAPSARFAATLLGSEELMVSLESGHVDVAFGSLKDLCGCVRSQTLAVDAYVCVMPSGRRDPAKPLTLRAFREAKHIVICANGLEYTHQHVERELREICRPENVRLVTESFLIAGLLVEQDDLILTAPSRVASLLSQRFDLISVSPPIDLPTFKVTQYWHERFHKEPGNQWLRRTIRKIFATPAK
ncbi:LysR family transcriptional regulator [Afipia sp. GAS231]|uniref:LysR family transcriptional regulator n=1 Tax=Afipia sp. GAS231 TaxID=1882747 RepID=UPI000B85EB39|nr:LysR family transcriptional regulator [Afipia sp. GAS231]